MSSEMNITKRSENANDDILNDDASKTKIRFHDIFEILGVESGTRIGTRNTSPKDRRTVCIQESEEISVDSRRYVKENQGYKTQNMFKEGLQILGDACPKDNRTLLVEVSDKVFGVPSPVEKSMVCKTAAMSSANTEKNMHTKLLAVGIKDLVMEKKDDSNEGEEEIPLRNSFEN